MNQALKRNSKIFILLFMASVIIQPMTRQGQAQAVGPLAALAAAAGYIAAVVLYDKVIDDQLIRADIRTNVQLKQMTLEPSPWTYQVADGDSKISHRFRTRTDAEAFMDNYVENKLKAAQNTAQRAP